MTTEVTQELINLAVFEKAGRISARTPSHATNPPSPIVFRSARSDASAKLGESVTTSSRTELSTAVNIASAPEIFVYSQPSG